MARAQTYSTYKSHNTVKILVGITPQGSISFVSNVWGGGQLDPVDVEQTCGIANVRIHVERVTGLLRRRYTILSGILPIGFLQCDPTGSQEAKIPMIDRIITVCAALTNLSNGIVPLD